MNNGQQDPHQVPLTKEKLYTSDGKYVVSVSIIPGDPRPGIIIWGQRFFVWRNPEQRYTEAIVAMALRYEYENKIIEGK